jgi:stalled ribosome rescue protein Dom34
LLRLHCLQLNGEIAGELNVASSRKYRRGYPVAALIGFASDRASLWKVYSHVVKPDRTVPLVGSRSAAKDVYNFHEAIVNALRPTLREGVQSIILASPPRTSFSQDFLRHLRAHHAWLFSGSQKAVFAELVGSAVSAHDVTELTRQPEFKKIVGETAEEETESLLELLERRLNAESVEPLVLYSFEEIEAAVLSPMRPGKPEPELVLLTDVYLSASRQKNRLQRLMQIAANKKIRTRVVKADSPAGKRLSQLGGFVCVLKPPQ